MGEKRKKNKFQGLGKAKMLQRAKLLVLELGWESQSRGSCGVDSVQLFITLLRISCHC